MAESALSARTADRIDAAGWRIVLLASLGGTLEFYDFVIFGVFARDIAAAVFPSTEPLVSLMASFAAFAAGYLARPIGGIVLSHYGDRHGRRAVFLWSVFVMSGATLGMGLVPSYAQWGVAASALMVTLRLIQGFCLGGELPGALTYVVETAPRIAPFVCGVTRSGTTLLRMMLDAHPQLAIPGETHWVPKLIRQLAEAAQAPGAIAQVVVQIAPAIRDGAGRLLHPLGVAGLLTGLGVMYLTGLMVSL